MKTKQITNSNGETVEAIPVSLKDWKNKPSDFKGIIDGIHYMMRLENGGTVSRPVYISDPDAGELAKTFARILHEALSEKQLQQVRERNRTEQNSSICHTHDFCDANQVIIDALGRHGIELDIQSDEQNRLTMQAWEIA